LEFIFNWNYYTNGFSSCFAADVIIYLAFFEQEECCNWAGVKIYIVALCGSDSSLPALLNADIPLG
jgi:hypothetical protein